MALGAILYRVVGGKPPFLGATAFETLLQVQRDEPVPLRQLAPRTPRDFETVCHKCLQKDPARRYASAAAFADDLRRFLDGQPVTARPVGRVEKGWKWVRRNPTVAGLLAAVVVLLVGGTVGIYVNYRDAREQADIARRQTERAERREGETAAVLGRMEVVIAQSALRTLRTEQFLEPQEWAALDDIAALAEDRPRILLVVRGLATDNESEKLVRHPAEVVRAAVGLDAGRRDAIEAAAMAVLSDAEASMARRRAAAMILSELPTTGRASSARTLADAVGRVTDAKAKRVLAVGLAKATADLDPDEAAGIVGPVAAALAGDSIREHFFGSRADCEDALEAVAPRLAPTDATAVARMLAAEIADPADQVTGRLGLGHGLAAAAGRLSRFDAEAVCGPAARSLADALGEETRDYHRGGLAEGLTALGERLAPAEATRLARTLAESLARETELYPLRKLADGVIRLAPRLPPADAAALAGPLADALIHTKDSWARTVIPSSLKALARRLAPADAATVARTLADGLAVVTDHELRVGLAESLAAVADRLPPADAARACGPTARSLADAIAGETSELVRAEFARGLAAVAGQLDPADASRLCGPIARTLAADFLAARHEYSRRELLDSLVGVADRLAPADAARILEDALAKESSPVARRTLATALALASRRSAGADATLDPATVGVLVDALARRPGDLTPARLAPLGGRLPDAEAVALIADALKMPNSVGANDAGLLAALTRLCLVPGGRIDPLAVVAGPAATIAWERKHAFRTVWDFVGWAEKNRPDLDLKSPPRFLAAGK